ncbi:Longin-like domain-containing protein [Sphaerosporella brunnea]|uniref:Coatomer subunit zeta n=1 Tax=Sphaerosporella brunnea TaxID=1250544 RepID=A0A5J5EZB5_9PEZI|nr:Longin-like domain-containing protein [Sphaerosporella brunnea]
MSPNLSLFSVNALLILGSDGTRIVAKYYVPPHSTSTSQNPYPTLKEQQAFEKGLLGKTVKSTADIILYDNHVVVFRAEGDVVLYVVGGLDENEMMLWQVILGLRDTLQILLKNSVDKRTIIENYDQVALAIEEIVDDGVILETDASAIVQRVSRPPQQDVQLSNIDLSEKGLLNAWEFGKKQLAERLRQGL